MVRRKMTRCPQGEELWEALLGAEGEELARLESALSTHLRSCPICTHFLEEEEEEYPVLDFPSGLPPLPRRKPHKVVLSIAGAALALLVLFLCLFPISRTELPRGPGVRGFFLLRGEERTLPEFTILLEVNGSLFPIPGERVPLPRERFRLHLSAREPGTLSLFALTGEGPELLARVHLTGGAETILPEEGFFPPLERLLLRFLPSRASSPPREYCLTFTEGGERE